MCTSDVLFRGWLNYHLLWSQRISVGKLSYTEDYHESWLRTMKRAPIPQNTFWLCFRNFTYTCICTVIENLSSNLAKHHSSISLANLVGQKNPLKCTPFRWYSTINLVFEIARSTFGETYISPFNMVE